MTSEKSERKAQRKARRQASKKRWLVRFYTLGGIICWVLLVILIAPMFLPRMLGYEVYHLTSSRMDPEVPAGSLILVQQTEPAELETGETICFYSGATIVCQRVTRNQVVEGIILVRGAQEEETTEGTTEDTTEDTTAQTEDSSKSSSTSNALGTSDSQNATVTPDERIPYSAIIGRLTMHVPDLGVYETILLPPFVLLLSLFTRRPGHARFSVRIVPPGGMSFFHFFSLFVSSFFGKPFATMLPGLFCVRTKA